MILLMDLMLVGRHVDVELVDIKYLTRPRNAVQCMCICSVFHSLHNNNLDVKTISATVYGQRDNIPVFLHFCRPRVWTPINYLLLATPKGKQFSTLTPSAFTGSWHPHPMRDNIFNKERNSILITRKILPSPSSI